MEILTNLLTNKTNNNNALVARKTSWHAIGLQSNEFENHICFTNCVKYLDKIYISML